MNASVWIPSTQGLLSSSVKILILVQFSFKGWNCLFGKLCNPHWSREREKKGHQQDVSILLMLYVVTFPETLWPASLCSLSCTVNWRKAADSGSHTRDKQQQVQIFFSRRQTRLALWSVKQARILLHRMNQSQRCFRLPLRTIFQFRTVQATLDWLEVFVLCLNPICTNTKAANKRGMIRSAVLNFKSKWYFETKN